MIWIISSVALTRQPNIGSGKPRNLNMSNLDRLEIMTRAATFALVNWNWWGGSFPFDLDCNVPNFNASRSDIAEFFQPSIDCIVKTVLEQKNSAHKTISVSLYTSFYKYRFPNHYPYFQHVVLVGGFAASDWLFSKVHELLTPLGLYIVRPENHVWVFSKIKTTILFKKKKTSSETKLFRMARSHSTSTTLWELVFLNSHMASLATSVTTQMSQTTDHGLIRCSPLFLGISGLMIISISSYPKWAV